MRKLKLQVQISIDGFIGGPDGTMDWLTTNWSQDINRYVADITDPVDTILLGKNLAMGFIPYWQGVAADPNHPEQEAGKKYAETYKVVFSKTLQNSSWDHTDIASGSTKEEVMKIKDKVGGDIIVYGGSSFVSSLIKEQLIDELHLFVNPVILGKGMPIFQDLADKQPCVLELTKSFDCGIVLHKFKLLKNG